MDNYSKIYWLTRLDAIHTLFAVVVGVCFTALVLYYISLFVNNDYMDEDDLKNYKKNWGKYKTGSFWAGIIATLMLAFMPTKNDMIIIYAGGKTMDYVEQDSSLSKIPYQATKVISDYLDEQISEMKKNNNDE